MQPEFQEYFAEFREYIYFAELREYFAEFREYFAEFLEYFEKFREYFAEFQECFAKNLGTGLGMCGSLLKFDLDISSFGVLRLNIEQKPFYIFTYVLKQPNSQHVSRNSKFLIFLFRY